MHVEIPTLETRRLRLRPFREDDLDDYAALCGDPEGSRYLLTGKPFSREATWRLIAFHLGHWLLRGAGYWAVEERETGAFVGRAGFCDPAGWPGFELAGALNRRVWGRSYSLELGRELLAFAFNVLGKDRVISCIVPENRAAIRVVERLGETLEGKAVLEGKEFLVFGIDRAEWETRRLRGRRTVAATGASAPPQPERHIPSLAAAAGRLSP
jgi:RimJ/RimL family protein N-acetyltransferase